MKPQNKRTGFAIALAWPETFCKQPGYWYDGVMNWLRFSQNHYYKVGHAALVLVNRSGDCFYFDFGRYHTPFQTGRVRSHTTDDGLKISKKAQISVNGRKIQNLREILTELQNNTECHGEGALFASYTQVHFEKSFQKAQSMQDKSPIPYGPFRWGGSNCSRFVNDCILAGKPLYFHSIRLQFPLTITPTPLSNVKAMDKVTTVPKWLKTTPFSPTRILDKTLLKNTLPKPARPSSIPPHAKWLSGEGAGSWFVVSPSNNLHKILRFDANGQFECRGLFQIHGENIFNSSHDFSIEYLSHCSAVAIKQNNQIIQFSRIHSA
jgi:hypothetical protein